MADGSIDVLMRVVGPKGPLAAESNTVFKDARIEKLREDFRPGFFCELREFNFSAGVASALDVNKKKDRKLTQAEQDDRAQRRREKQELYNSMNQAQRREHNVLRLEKRHLKSEIARGRGDPVDMQEVEFTRVMDAMSMPLFQCLAGCETLNEISVAKRKAAGTTNSGEIYLRLDFEKVLMTELGWKDSNHLILENGAFIYRRVTIRYRPQLPNGTLGAVIQSEWEMKSMQSMQSMTA